MEFDTDASILPDTPEAGERTGREVDTVSSLNALQRIRKSVEAKATDTVRYTVPENQLPGIDSLELEFTRTISTQELDRYQRLGRKKNGKKDDVDAGKVAGLVLAEKSVAIYMDGKKVTDDEGDPLNLRSQEMLDLVSCNNAADAVRALLGDGATTSFSDALVQAAGYGDDVVAGNPMSSN